jgi:hypothetical protein
MKSDLQKAALQKLAGLTQKADPLSPGPQGSLHHRFLSAYAEQKKLANGVNGGINGIPKNNANRMLV